MIACTRVNRVAHKTKEIKVNSARDMYLVNVRLLDRTVEDHTERAEQNSQRLFGDEGSQLVRDVGDVNRRRFDAIVMLRGLGILFAAKRCPADTVTKLKVRIRSKYFRGLSSYRM